VWQLLNCGRIQLMRVGRGLARVKVAISSASMMGKVMTNIALETLPLSLTGVEYQILRFVIEPLPLLMRWCHPWPQSLM